MNNSAEVGTFIIFAVANQLLALPISAVAKVINRPPVESSLETGLVHLGQQTIPLLDLHQKINHQASPTALSPFLVVTHWSESEVYAIPVDEPPNLVKIPQECIRALPDFERDGIFQLVNQVAVLSQEEKTITIFLLNNNQTLKSLTSQPQSQADSTVEIVWD